MIRLTWEETILIILFSAIIGGSLVKGNWSVVAASAIFVGFIIVAAARAPLSSHDHSSTENAGE